MFVFMIRLLKISSWHFTMIFAVLYIKHLFTEGSQTLSSFVFWPEIEILACQAWPAVEHQFVLLGFFFF